MAECMLDGDMLMDSTLDGELQSDGAPLDGDVGAYAVAASYADLPDKPSINGTVLVGDVTIPIGITTDDLVAVTESEIEALWTGEEEE